MIKKNRILLISVISGLYLVAVLQLLSLLTTNFLLEMVSSFLPLWVISNSLILAIAFIIIRLPRSRTLLLESKYLYYALITAFITIAISTLTAVNMIYAFSYSNRPNNHVVNANQDEIYLETQPIKIASFNKLYTNQNYDEIDLEINSTDADVVALIEFTEHDTDQIPSLEDYQYSYTDLVNEFDHTLVGISIFSKYPMEIEQDTLNKDYELRRLPVIKANITIEGVEDPLQIVALHTAAPSLPELLPIRGKQLKGLTGYINNLPVEDQKNLIIMGDFNLSPWAPDYNKLINRMPNLVDTAKGDGLKFTWSMGGKPFFYSQIDHIFVSNDLTYGNFKVGGKGGSDHHLVSIVVYPKKENR